MVSSRIFRSRRAALFWAAGIIWTAYDVAMATRVPPAAATTNSASPDPLKDATGDTVDPRDLAVLANAVS